MTDNLKIGCCGFGGSKERYFKKFKTVEVQQTFYDPPQIKTLENWRKSAPEDFEFTIKAWQIITHESSSPTYRRLRMKFSDSDLSKAGSFKDTKIVWQAFEKTIESALILKARAIIFQCPSSFKPANENIKNIQNFFSRAVKMLPSELKEISLVWEPRGDWKDDIIEQICRQFGLIHCVDIFVRKPVTEEKFYFRLHGGKDYRHSYTDSELEWLLLQIKHFAGGFCMFNNLNMINDAQRLLAKIVIQTKQDSENMNKTF